MAKIALITGITGQDGSYLAELLLEKGYLVHGIIRRSSSFNTDRIDHIFKDIHEKNVKLILHYGDLTDAGNCGQLIQEIQPDEIYNLAAQSHVRVSFDIPVYTTQVDALGTVHLMEAVRKHCPKAKFYQASSSEMFGKIQDEVQTEKTPFYPRSPYGVSKVFSFWFIKNYREAYGLYACNGILFNHESPRRGGTFVTRKITRAVAEIKAGKQELLYLGNLDAKRDWGYAPDYVEAMWRMLQQEKPDDFVIATGETHSVREFCEASFKHAGMELAWKGEGVEEIGIEKSSGKTIIKIDPKYFRPTEVDCLLGDASKAKKELQWEPRVTFEKLVQIMTEADIKALEEGSDYKFR